ncbi:hypothetical protein [Methanosarcina lacustris]|uniref:hypothetical protein n=1 Tax=Methanosarcina lacustris TaxID=170861 RepID=UPI000ACCB064|nr:hypothetical protein [Methanosarcina lacustris]
MINGIFILAVADVLFGVGLMDITDKLFLKGIGNIVALVGIIYLLWYVLNEGKAILVNL